MAKAKVIEPNESTEEIHILTKNFGARMGNSFVFYEKGTEFNATDDSPIISALYRMGASIELKA